MKSRKKYGKLVRFVLHLFLARGSDYDFSSCLPMYFALHIVEMIDSSKDYVYISHVYEYLVALDCCGCLRHAE